MSSSTEPMDASRQEKMYGAARELARLINDRFGTSIPATALERFLIANWAEVSDLAHLIYAKPR